MLEEITLKSCSFGILVICIITFGNYGTVDAATIYSLSTTRSINQYDAVTGAFLGEMGLSQNQSIDGGLAYAPSPVPLPLSIWLFGSGLLGLIGVAKKKAA